MCREDILAKIHALEMQHKLIAEAALRAARKNSTGTSAHNGKPERPERQELAARRHIDHGGGRPRSPRREPRTHRTTHIDRCAYIHTPPLPRHDSRDWQCTSSPSAYGQALDSGGLPRPPMFHCKSPLLLSSIVKIRCGDARLGRRLLAELRQTLQRDVRVTFL